MKYWDNLSLHYRSQIYKSSRQEVFCKKGVLRNFAKFTGKHLSQSLFLIKLQTFVKGTVTEIKKKLWNFSRSNNETLRSRITTNNSLLPLKFFLKKISDPPLLLGPLREKPEIESRWYVRKILTKIHKQFFTQCCLLKTSKCYFLKIKTANNKHCQESAQ